MNNTVNQIDNNLKNMKTTMERTQEMFTALDSSMVKFCAQGERVAQTCNIMGEGFKGVAENANSAVIAIREFNTSQGHLKNTFTDTTSSLGLISSLITITEFLKNGKGGVSSAKGFGIAFAISVAADYLRENFKEYKAIEDYVVGYFNISNPFYGAYNAMLKTLNGEPLLPPIEKRYMQAERSDNMNQYYHRSDATYVEKPLQKFQISSFGENNQPQKKSKEIQDCYTNIGIAIAKASHILVSASEKNIQALEKERIQLKGKYEDITPGSRLANAPLLSTPTIPQLEITPIQVPIEIDKNAFANTTEQIKQTTSEISEFMFDWGTELSTYLGDSISSLMESLGTAIGSGDWSGAFQGMLLSMMDMLKSFGEALIAAGTAGLAFKALMKNPVLAIVAGAALVVTASIAKAALQKTAQPMANGGIVYGTTYAMVGEYPGAANNPEVVAPLNKLRSLIEPSFGMGNGRVEFKIAGRELVGIFHKMNNIKQRTR